jgi:hypothetical protein
MVDDSHLKGKTYIEAPVNKVMRTFGLGTGKKYMMRNHSYVIRKHNNFFTLPKSHYMLHVSAPTGHLQVIFLIF